MPQRPSPYPPVQAARQELAGRLREIREGAGLTSVALAAAAGWERTKISKIEHGARAPSADVIRTWCHARGAEDQTEDLLAALRAAEGAYVEWKRLQRAGLRRLQEAKMPLYERTRTQRVYCSQVVPGLLQTPGYATALLTAITTRFATPNDVEDAVAARGARQSILRKPGHRFAFIVEEAVFYYRLGGNDDMAEQLNWLREAARLPSVSLGVIPLGAARPGQWVLETFTLYDVERVEVELLSAQVTVTTPSEITRYTAAFEDLAAMAVYGEAARNLMERALTTYR
ncbi:helix-turn-helix transcriptional regulator [Actinomadura sp. WMMB 499]|uniref:helix-turn-helix domain-containing protein n=1 Tax=Actinomadura sp. WMMB 499 TaxID=1219491 RepID=UPI0012471110|nr:helix-turn-helix transcriptional regulator [Actinomadura sp. WMMB 499]QFG21395.1 helix-turn-helix transcriptional regulator [Actinomadura sp. WMMB 499]